MQELVLRPGEGPLRRISQTLIHTEGLLSVLPGIATTMTVTATIRISTNSLPLTAGLAGLFGSCATNLKNKAKNKMIAALVRLA